LALAENYQQGGALKMDRRVCFSKWARMARMTAGYSMLATIRTAPPQWMQVLMSWRQL